MSVNSSRQMALVLLHALLLELLLVLLHLRLLLDGVLGRELGLELPLAEASLLSPLLAAVGVLALGSTPVRDAEASLQSNLGAAVGVLAFGLDLSAPRSRSLKRASSETQLTLSLRP